MSAAAELALIRDAYEALPQGTPQERTAWIIARKAALLGEAPPSARRVSVSQPRPHESDAAMDAAMRRLCGGDK